MSGDGVLVSETFRYAGGRQVSVHVPPDPPEAVVFVADGGWHTARLQQALASATAPATMLVGVHGLPDDEGRLQEYVPGFDDDRFAAHEEFFVHEVGAWVATRFDVALPAEQTAVWGASLGGELALALGLRHPGVFGAVFAASPGAGYRPPAAMPAPLPRVYLVAGTEEPFFLENATRWAGALRDAGTEVVMTTRPGPHGGDFWAAELPLMVSWAFDP